MPDENRPKETYTELRDAYNDAKTRADSLADRLDELRADPEATPEQYDAADAEFNAAIVDCEELWERLQSKEARDRARAQFKPIPTGNDIVKINEPDLYVRGGRSFMADLYHAQLKGDPASRERLEKHQRLEVEKRAVSSTTLGGFIPPQYLLDLYAKAGRNGRVYADQANRQALPDVGMSLIVPRITTPTAVGIQATENNPVTTQDPVETDLTVNVRTIAGYSPVSRQGLERAAYSDQILFEDLVARYFATLDGQCISGAGTGGTILGVLSTAGISTSTVSTTTVAGVYPKIADLIQQIEIAVGGLGYRADKIIMHPRRWAFFAAALDNSGRPLMLPTGTVTGASVGVFNPVATGDEAAYGLVGSMHGLNVYTDANIPTNLGAGTNEDRIIVEASQVVHLWERANDPVTLSFEQQAGTSLQVQLVVYGYAAFTAGRYPAASGVVSGAGLVPPTF
jgi:HK97 family phage major capsid protein